MARGFLLALSLLIPALASAAESTAEQALAGVIAEYERVLKQTDPISAGQEGDREALRRWPDVRPATAKANRRTLERLAEQLSKIDASGLSSDSSLNHALLVRQIAVEI